MSADDSRKVDGATQSVQTGVGYAECIEALQERTATSDDHRRSVAAISQCPAKVEHVNLCSPDLIGSSDDLCGTQGPSVGG